MASKHYRDNFLFARAEIAKSLGVSQHVAYAVNPAPVEIVKGLYFPATGEIAFHAMHKGGKRLSAEAVYQGKATEEFREAVLNDKYRSDENPMVMVSYCVMEEYGLARAQDLEGVPKHPVEIEFVELSEVITFRFIEHMDNSDDGKHRAKYEILFANNLTIPLEIRTADDPSFLEDVSYDDNSITVGGVVFSLDMSIVRFLRLYKWAGFDRDLFGKNQESA